MSMNRCSDSEQRILDDSACEARQKIVSKKCTMAECAHWKVNEWSQVRLSSAVNPHHTNVCSVRRLAIVDGNRAESHALMAINKKLQTDIAKVYNQNQIYIYCVIMERVRSGESEIGQK